MKKKWKDIMVMIPGKMKKHKKLTAALLVLFVLAGVFAGLDQEGKRRESDPDSEGHKGNDQKDSGGQRFGGICCHPDRLFFQ